jgi:autotransporter-associated beta strand protein
MKSKLQYATGLVTLALILPAAADIIYDNLQQAIPTTYGGLTVAVGDGTLNPFFGGACVANNNALQPFRVTDSGGLATIMDFGAGVTIGSGSGYLATGSGGSIDHLGAGGTFTAGAEGYVGFKLDGANYGWMRVVLTNNTSTPVTPVVKDWAYDNTGAAIKTGWIHTDFVSGTAQAVTLNPGTGESFTLGSQLANASGTITNSVAKTGAGTAVLTGNNTYTGATTVNAGTLKIDTSGTLNSSSGVAVAAGATLVYNSSTTLSAVPTLNGTGTGVGQRAVLGGTGTVGTSVTLDNFGDTLAPGNSPGIQTYTLAQTWSSFSYDWEINNFTGTTAGTDFDQIGLGSTLDLSGGTGSYILNVLGLTAGNESGLVPDFSEISRSWTILTSSGTLSGFDAANWTIHTAGFSDPATGTWALAQSGNDLVLSYTAVPEPSAVALLGGCGVLALLRRRRLHQPAITSIKI